MHKKCKIAIGITAYAAAVCLLIEMVGYSTEKQEIRRVWHHEAAAGADTQLGLSEIPDDFIVDESFVTHLPLVVIDTGGVEIPNYKYYDSKTDSFFVEEGKEPYIDMNIAVIDNDSMVNRLGDVPDQSSDGRIKIRGNTSSSYSFPKKQYTIKLKTEDGENNPMELMGMTSADTWILNGTQLDKSYMRNYIAMNSGGELDSFTPDMRYCEAVFKDGDQYKYMGLYILYEKIEQGEGRVEIPKASPSESISDRSYLLLRDRLSQSGYNMSVYSTEHQDERNYISLEYPSERSVTPEYWEYIQEDICHIEKVLYSDEYKDFIQYRKLLDVDSFVDYFIINEFFANYDSGWNSTYLYKGSDGRISIGPFWDFDGGLDNFKDGLLEMGATAMQEAPWFDRLLTDSWFVEKVTSRYRELRDGLLSEENLEQRVEEVKSFIEKPVRRDMSRWGALYNRRHEIIKEKETDLLIDRNVSTWEEETERVMDVMRMHGDYLDENITDLYQMVNMDNSQLTNTTVGFLFILAFFVSVILVQRARKGI